MYSKFIVKGMRNDKIGIVQEALKQRKKKVRPSGPNGKCGSHHPSRSVEQRKPNTNGNKLLNSQRDDYEIEQINCGN